MVLSRTTAWTALSLTFPLDHFFFFADLPPLEAAGFAADFGGYGMGVVSFLYGNERMPSKVKNRNPSQYPARDRQQGRYMWLAGRLDDSGDKKMRKTHHVVGGRRPSVKTGLTTRVVFTGAVPTVRVSRAGGPRTGWPVGWTSTAKSSFIQPIMVHLLDQEHFRQLLCFVYRSRDEALRNEVTGMRSPANHMHQISFTQTNLEPRNRGCSPHTTHSTLWLSRNSPTRRSREWVVVLSLRLGFC